MMYVLDVFMADTSSLKNRALVFAFSTTPYIATTWIGPPAAESFLDTSGWPWAFGTFSIITPVICLPILTLLWWNQGKAKKAGLIKRIDSGRTWKESVSYYFWEFDGKLAYPLISTLQLTAHSNRSSPHLRRLRTLPPPLFPCLLSKRRLARRNDHCHARNRYLLSHCFRLL